MKPGGNRGAVIPEMAQEEGHRSAQRGADQRADELAPVVLRMQEKGLSLNAMAGELTSQGIPTARGGRVWKATQVKRVTERM